MVGAAVAAADAAMGALPPGRLQAVQEQASPAARAELIRYQADPGKVLARWLFVRTLATALTAVLVGEIPVLHVDRTRPLLAVAGALFLCGTLYELAAAVARARATTAGPLLLRVLRPLEIAAIPFAAPLSYVGRKIGDTFASDLPQAQETRLAETEVEYLVEDAAKTGQLGAEPAEMIRNVLDFKDLTARDVMVPRIKFAAIEVETPLDELLRIVTSEGHSRYPVYAGKIDNVVGLLYTKDLFLVLQSKRTTATVSDIMRTPVNFIPETQPVSVVLRDMRSRKHHMAILVDEYGGVSGLVTLEDILERIVGDIRDEYDREEAPIQDLGDGRLLADAAVSLADLSAYLGTEIEGDGDYGSLGGLLTHEAGKVPPAGEHIVASGIEFIVRESDEKRIVRVEIILPPSSAGSSSMLPATPSTEIPP